MRWCGGGLPSVTEREVDQRVQARRERQALLQGADPLQVWAIMDEAVLRRSVGSPTVMVDQVQRLIDSAVLPSVTIQMIPYAAGAHPGMSGSFILLEFPTRASGTSCTSTAWPARRSSNGKSMFVVDQLVWCKSSRSSANGARVEVAELPDGGAVRDSKNSDGLVLTCSTNAWSAFIAEIRRGSFDLH